eukprot:jgi/Hompol1/167/HPOL_003017-RA
MPRNPLALALTPALELALSLDVLGGRPLPSCPYSSSSLPPRSQALSLSPVLSQQQPSSPYLGLAASEAARNNQSDARAFALQAPATSVTLLLFSVAALVMGCVTLVHLDMVRIFNRRIAHRSVRNRESAALLLLLAFAFAIDFFRYSLGLAYAPRPILPSLADPSQDPQTPIASAIVGPHIIDAWLLMASALVRCIAVFVLSLALNQQRVHRSTDFPQDFDGEDDDSINITLESVSENSSIWHLPSILFFKAKNSLRLWLRRTFFKWDILALIPLQSTSDPAAFADDSVQTTFFGDPAASAATSDTRVVVIVVMSIIQIIPLYVLVFIIATTDAQSRQGSLTVSPRSRRRRRRYGPTSFTKLLFFAGVVLTTLWWIEPSLTSRAIESHILTTMDPRVGYEGSVCIVPPWWWIEVPANTTMPSNNAATISTLPQALSMQIPDRVALKAHGWASWMDVGQWIAFLGLWCLFVATRAEYKRNMEEWIWITVSEVQNTFDFRR